MPFTPTVERVAAVAIALVGAALIVVGSMAHLDWLKAPGALAITAGGAWLGVALARQNVLLFPDRAREREGEPR